MSATRILDTFPSSRDPDIRYEVTHKGLSGYLQCNCPGFEFRRDCWHVTAVAAKLPGGSPIGLVAAALEFARRGYHVIPVEPGGKMPLVQWLPYQTEKPSAQQIAEWWRHTPAANIGLVLGGGRLAVDLDGGDEAEAMLAAVGIELPAGAPRVRTASGFHVYMQHPAAKGDRIGLLRAPAPRADASITPAGKARVAQVDIRTHGIVIAPPSVHSSGVEYAWMTPLTDVLPMAPDALLALMYPPPPPKKQRGLKLEA